MMTKFVLDSDCLIKLTKSQIPKKLVENFNCIISEKVYDECVVEGKKRFYEDAFQIDDLVISKKLGVRKAGRNVNVRKMIGGINTLGSGEISTLFLFFNTKAVAVISDDQAFLDVLYKNSISFIVPVDVIIRLTELRVITVKEALEGLERLAPYIREKDYLRAKKLLEVKKYE